MIEVDEVFVIIRCFITTMLQLAHYLKGDLSNEILKDYCIFCSCYLHLSKCLKCIIEKKSIVKSSAGSTVGNRQKLNTYRNFRTILIVLLKTVTSNSAIVLEIL